MSERPVKVILDTSAIVAFTRGSIYVGEVIAEVDDEDAAAGLPVLCLVEASSVVADGNRLELLVNHPATRMLAPDPGDWQALAAIYDTVGRLDAASAVLAAIAWAARCSAASPACTRGWREADRSSGSDSWHTAGALPTRRGGRVGAW